MEVEHKRKVGIYFDNYYKRDKDRPWFRKCNVRKGLVTLINRLRANHYNLNESLARKNYIGSARCKCKAEVQNIEHIVWGYRLYDEERPKLHGKMTKWKIKYPYAIKKWLKECDLDPFKLIWEFLSNIGKII